MEVINEHFLEQLDMIKKMLGGRGVAERNIYFSNTDRHYETHNAPT